MYSLPQSYNQTSKCKRCICPNAYLNKSILVIVLDKETKQVIKRKLVIPNSIADDLSAIRDGKIFEIPVE